jgi:hypothetical protein
MPLDLRSLARSYTEMCVRQLASVANQSESDNARVSACALLLERGWGKAEQPHTGDGGGDIRITIRQIVEGSNNAATQPQILEQKPNLVKIK